MTHTGHSSLNEKTLNLNTPDVLLKLLVGHDIHCETHSGWCVPNGELPAIRTVWTDGEDVGAGRLDVEVLLPDERRIFECFAGLGDSPEECQKDALQNFLRSSFHVLLTANWGHEAPEQVDIESWSINGDQWKAYIGGFSNRASAGVDVIVPDDYFDQIVSAIHESSLDADTHWFRTYFCNIGSNDRIHEALIDNETWVAGETMMKSVNWTDSDGFYSIRNFIMLKRPESLP